MSSFIRSSLARGHEAGWVFLSLVALLFILGAAGCAAPAEDSAPEAAAAAPAEDPFTLPVSHNDVMVALVNHAADPIWLAAWREPQDEKQWRELERLSTQLQLGGALLTIPGTGPVDEQWTSQPGWVDWAEQLEQAGAMALAAAQSREVPQVSAAGDRIVEVCEGCHMDFKPDLPTGGKFGELSPTAADFEGDEE